MVGEINATVIPDDNLKQIGQPDLIISLGRYVSTEGELSLSDINRHNMTAHLARTLGVHRIITTGGGQASLINPNYAEAIKGKEHLVMAGIPDTLIHPEPFSAHTWENAIYSRRLIETRFREERIRKIIAVSSIWHDRTWDIFDHSFGDDYEIIFIGAPDPPSPHDLAAEISGVAVKDRVIEATPRGDLEAIESYSTQIITHARPVLMPLAA